MQELIKEYSIYVYVLMYLYLFLLGSVSGFFIEVIYRRYVSVKRWVNPGFMKGPWIPLYGFGVVIMSAITTLINYAFSTKGIYLYNPDDFYLLGKASNGNILDLIPIITMGLGMTVLELIAGLIFVKGFKVRLWDYSNDKGNFMGVICPKFAIIWIIVAVLFYYGLSPFIYRLALINTINILNPTKGHGLPQIWIILLIGIVYGMIILDFINSLGLFNRVSKSAKKLGKIIHYDRITESISLFRKETGEQIKKMLPNELKDAIANYESKDPKTTLKYKIRTLLYIDPDKKENKNFDESGRPITEEEYENRKNS